MDCLQDWGDFMRLGIPGMLMLGAEWWTYELGAFLAGKIYRKYTYCNFIENDHV